MGAVTEINADYLRHLQHELQDLQAQVETQLSGLGTTGAVADTTEFINPIDKITLRAGTSDFAAGAAISSALQNMGGSVHNQLLWLKRVLTDMISEITSTVNSFQDTESLNNEDVSKLIGDFQHTINDMNGPSNSNPNTPATS